MRVPAATAALLAIVSAAACAKVQTSTTYTQTLISQRTTTETLPDSLRFSATPRLDGQTLAVELRSEETCRTKVVPLYRKHAHIERTAANDPLGHAFAPTSTLIAGGLFVGSGVLGYVGADELGVTNGDPDQGTPDDYRTGGLVLAATGVALLGIALVDAIRLRDEHAVVGDVDGEAKVTEGACHGRATANQAVIATSSKLAWQTEATTDAEGKARLDLHELPEAAFVRDELRLELNIAGAWVPIVLAADPTRGLLGTLASDPTSRVARDREARAVATCAQQVAEAAAVQVDAETPPSVIARTEATWSRARQTCGDKWEPSHEQAQAAFVARVDATRAERAAKQCEEAGDAAAQLVVQRSNADEPLEADDLEESVAARCHGAANADKVLAALASAVKTGQQARVRAARRAQLIEQLNDRLQRNDAAGLRAIVARDADAAALLGAQRDAATWIHAIASHWIGQLERGASIPATHAQLCASRSLVLQFSGPGAWARLRADVAKRTDVAKGARIAKAMDGGGCP